MGVSYQWPAAPLINPHNPYNPWVWWRSQMPACEKFAYLDHAAVAALPEPARDQLVRWADEASSLGGTAWPHWTRDIEELREKVAHWVNADPDEIALLFNTTSGINLVAEGWPWQPGDQILILAQDFPSNRLPWLRLRDQGVEVIEVDSCEGAMPPEQITQHLTSRTRLVVVSWVDYARGFRLDLKAISQAAHAVGAALFVDAIQGLGVFPLDVREMGVDFFAADGHKWMLGPEGAAIAYVKQDYWDRLHCHGVGWNSVVSRYDFSSHDTTLRPSAARWEGGSANACGLLALRASLELHWSVQSLFGRNAIADRVMELNGLAQKRLQECGANVLSPWQGESRSGIVNFTLPGISPQEIRRYCREQNIIVNCRGPGVRVSLHAFNNESDLERLVRALCELRSSSTLS